MKLNKLSKKKQMHRQVLDLIPLFILRNSIKKFQIDKVCHKYKINDQLVVLNC